MITSDNISSQKTGTTTQAPRRDRTKYIIEKKENETIYKHNGDISGCDFKIRRNTNCTIYILDYTTGMFIDDCINCKIITGPCSGSIFMRTSKNCSLSTITRQLRFRDCENIKVFTHCPTDPAVESSFNIFFAPYNSFYPHLKEHFIKSGFDENESNHMGTPYDFTPDKILGNGEKHFDKMKKDDFYIEEIADGDDPIEEMFNGYIQREKWIQEKEFKLFGKGNNGENNENNEKNENIENIENNENEKNDDNNVKENNEKKDLEDGKKKEKIQLIDPNDEELNIKRNKRRTKCCPIF